MLVLVQSRMRCVCHAAQIPMQPDSVPYRINSKPAQILLINSSIRDKTANNEMMHHFVAFLLPFYEGAVVQL